MKLTSFSHGYGQNAQHFVFVPKYRHKIFEDVQVRFACTLIFKEIAKRHGFKIHELRVAVDHVHLFVEIPPAISVSKAVQLFKGCSAYLLFKYFPYLRKVLRKGHLWSAGKFYRSVGNVTAETIEHYIAQSQGNNFASSIECPNL